MTKNNILFWEGILWSRFLSIEYFWNCQWIKFFFLHCLCDIWHTRLGHVNSSYVMKLQRLWMWYMCEI